MKNFALFFTAVGSAFSFHCFAQNSDHVLNNSKTSNTQLLSDMSASNDLAVVSYHVEERINMNFGGRITTYNVPSLDMINDNNLGENNTRVVTPKYAKVRSKPVAVVSLLNNVSKPETPIASSELKPVYAAAPTASVGKDHVSIDVVSTYERIMDKGYKSVDMLIKVADRHFFEGDMVLAAKWYTELFNNNTDNLEAVYYYRYAQSLISVGQKEKGNAMMKIFETKSL